MDKKKQFAAIVLPAVAVFISGLILMKAITQPQPQGWRIVLAVAGFTCFLLMFLFSRSSMKKGKSS